MNVNVIVETETVASIFSKEGCRVRKWLSVILFLASIVTAFSQVQLPRNETLYTVGSFAVATAWNLYSPQPTWGTNQFLYVPLYLYEPGRDIWFPILAEGYQFLSDRIVRIKIRDQAFWSDGVPITAWDVEYTFNLTKKLGIGPGAGWEDYVEYVKAVDAKTVEFKAREDNLNYFQFLSYAFMIRPVPKHVYSKLEEKGINIRDWVNDDPKSQVVSGPYRLFHYDPSIIVYERIENWWGKDVFGLPRPKYLANPIFKDNPAASLALEQGNIDWAGLFIPSVWELWEKKKLPIGTWFKQKPYFLPAALILLYVNQTKYPLNDPNVKLAMAYAIPYQEMLEKAFFGYSIQAHPSMVIDLIESNKQYINYDLWKKAFGTADGRIPTDLAKANKILDEAGFKKGRDGIRIAPDGTRLGPYTISVPYGWTDWMMMCEMIAKNLREIGIDVATEFPDFSVWWDRMIKGTFDMLICWSAWSGFDHPFNVYRWVMDYRLTGPVGEPYPAGNWQRYKNEEVIKLLDKAVSTLNIEKMKEVYFKIQEIIHKDFPSIPMFYGTVWYEYSEKYWTNWPSEKNPYWYRCSPGDGEGPLPVLFGICLKADPKPVPSWFETVDKGGYMVPTSKIMETLQKVTK